MVFAYSEEAVGQLEHDFCTAKARIRELEAEVVKIARAHAEQQEEIRGLRDNVVRKDAALAAIGKALEPFPELQERIPDNARALIAAALKEEKA